MPHRVGELKPVSSSRLGHWILGIVVALVLVIPASISLLVLSRQQGSVVPATQKPVETEFNLPVDQRRPTVRVGPGTHHNIWANKPYVVWVTNPSWNCEIARPREPYEAEMGNTKVRVVPCMRPAGWSDWNGGTIEGPLELEGLSDGTVVRISRVSS